MAAGRMRSCVTLVILKPEQPGTSKKRQPTNLSFGQLKISRCRDLPCLLCGIARALVVRTRLTGIPALTKPKPESLMNNALLDIPLCHGKAGA